MDHGQLTYYSHQNEAKWNQLIEDTFAQAPLKVTTEKLSVNDCTVWNMRMKLQHAFKQIQQNTLLSDEIELEEKYILNSHKGTRIEGG